MTAFTMTASPSVLQPKSPSSGACELKPSLVKQQHGNECTTPKGISESTAPKGLSVVIPATDELSIEIPITPVKKMKRAATDPISQTCPRHTRSKTNLDFDLMCSTFYSPQKQKRTPKKSDHQQKLQLYKNKRRARARSLSGNFTLTSSSLGNIGGLAGLQSPTTPRLPTTPTTPRISSSSKRGTLIQGGSADRFIPSRKTVSKAAELHKISNENTTATNLFKCLSPQSTCSTPQCPTHELTSPVDRTKRDFNSKLSEALLGVNDSTRKLLRFSSPQIETVPEDHQRTLRELYINNTKERAAPKPMRHISNAPERILDAPQLLDDYYLNLLHWSAKNILAVGLGTNLYLWNAATGDIDTLVENSDPENFITSVKWNADGTKVAVGSTDTTVQIWDVAAQKQTSTQKGHLLRVGAMAWNDSLLSTGSRDSTIRNTDTRCGMTTSIFQGHEEEICGLDWSRDGSQLASGGNDNICCVWDKGGTTDPKFTFRQHTAAVKALAWCPFQTNLLATGGGTADRHIRFFNTTSGQCLNAVDTKSQVCSLVWSKHSKELLSAHGFSQNQLTVWKYPHMTQIANLTGHTSRVLHTAISPDGTTVCSAAADETLRFWKVWDPAAPKKTTKWNFTSILSRNIR